jgi:dolichyl-diphosphooligosaccharide---protein glycosyltransferase
MQTQHDSNRLPVSICSGIRSLISVLVLIGAYLCGFLSRLFSIIRFESIIHEFDPWFIYNFLNWFDELVWYPLGRSVGGTIYPGKIIIELARCHSTTITTNLFYRTIQGLMITSGTIHWFLHAINIPIHIRDICVFLAPVFSGFTAFVTYLLTKELWSSRAGLFAAAFIAIIPGYSSRSVAGSYDNEGK